MDIETYRDFCLLLKGSSEALPFDDRTLVFKVMGKIYSITDIELFESINLKCDPEKALELRERYAAVTPGYHMNKRHWNTIALDGSVSDAELLEWTRTSYDLVVAKLTRKEKVALDEL